MEQSANAQLAIIGPLAILLIFLILFALYGNFKFPITIALGTCSQGMRQSGLANRRISKRQSPR